MRDPLETLREDIEAWRTREALALVELWRGSRGPTHPLSAAANMHRRIADLERLQSALSRTTPASAGALSAHVARWFAERALGPARKALGEASARPVDIAGHATPLSSAIEAMLDADAPAPRRDHARALTDHARAYIPALLHAREQAREAGHAVLGLAPERPDAPRKDPPIVETARRWLAATHDAFLEIRARADVSATEWQEAAAFLRAQRPAGSWRVSERARQIGGMFAPLGLQPLLAARCKVEPAHSAIDPRARVIAVRVPTDVRVSFSRLDLGVASELAAIEGVGRALALSLTEQSLATEFRRPLDATVPRAIGALFSGLVADVVAVGRHRSLDARASEPLRRVAAYAVVLDARIAAAAVAAREGPSHGEALREILSTAGVEIPGSLAALIASTPGAQIARFRGKHAAFGLALAFRDRFDEDWFRNPRVGDVLRGACARGGAFSVEAWLEELGAPSDFSEKVHALAS